MKPASPFIFESYTFNTADQTLALRYAYEGGAAFEERIAFKFPYRQLSAHDKAALDHAFRLLFLLAGVSYYKAYLPAQLICKAFPLHAMLARWMEKVYLHGLGEFAYQNKLSLKGKINFVADDTAPEPQAATLALPRLSCVPVGGGKDSTVTLECLKQAQEPIVLFALGNAEPIKQTIAVSGLSAIHAERTLDPALFALNAQGAYNGHVPITAILSAITVACAILHGFDTIVMSNEHSASAPNLSVDGLDINHQYSKSLSFEQDFAGIIASTVTPSLCYFSFLRPLSETAITKRFARLEAYHPVFRSCNTAFKQDEQRRNKNWCCDCPKCRFVFLAMAPFMPREKLIGIFGQNLLNDPAQQQGFAELAGISAFKPFECVGEVEESAMLLAKLAAMHEWKNDEVVKALSQQLQSSAGDLQQRYDALFTYRADHGVPDDYIKVLHACG